MASQLVPIGQQPRMLKDFLADNSHSRNVSFFQENVIAAFSNKALSKFLIKCLPFASTIKSPSLLPRSITRRLSSSTRVHKNVKELTINVKVKDILRWRSFRDLDAEESPPLDVSASPYHCTTVTATTGSTGTTRSSSSRSSWCDSDFTAEDLQWCVNSNGEEQEQNSPVSVLDLHSEEHKKTFSYFHQTPKSRQNRNDLITNKNVIQEGKANGVEEKAMHLLNQAKVTSSSIDYIEIEEEFLLLDYFTQELSYNKKADHEDLLRVAKCWVRGEDDGSLEWNIVGKKEFSIKDMERGVEWNKFDEDEHEFGLEMEKELLNHLVDEVLFDFLNL